MRLAPCTVLLLALTARPAFAQPRYHPEVDGVVAPLTLVATPGARADFAVTPADVKAWQAGQQRLYDAIRAVPLFNPPRGFNVKASASLGLGIGQPGESKGRPLAGGLMVGAFALIDVPVRRRAPGAPAVRLGESGETVNLVMELNAIDSVLQRVGARTAEDAEGIVALEPVRGPDRYGVPRYGDALIVTRDDRRPWAPVTADRAWRFIVAKRREVVEQAGPPDPQTESYYGRVKRSLDRAEAALAALSPEARALPACYVGDTNRLPEGRIVAPGTESCVPLVAPDPSFFTPGVPRSAFQVLLVYRVSECEDAVASKRIPPENLGNCAANLKLLEQLDWGRVRALLR